MGVSIDGASTYELARDREPTIVGHNESHESERKHAEVKHPIAIWVVGLGWLVVSSIMAPKAKLPKKAGPEQPNQPNKRKRWSSLTLSAAPAAPAAPERAPEPDLAASARVASDALCSRFASSASAGTNEAHPDWQGLPSWCSPFELPTPYGSGAVPDSAVDLTGAVEPSSRPCSVTGSTEPHLVEHRVAPPSPEDDLIDEFSDIECDSEAPFSEAQNEAREVRHIQIARWLERKRRIANMINDAESMQIISAAWLETLNGDKYTDKLQSDIDALVLKLTRFMSHAEQLPPTCQQELDLAEAVLTKYQTKFTRLKMVMDDIEKAIEDEKKAAADDPMWYA